MREEYYDSLTDRRYITLEAARKQKKVVDFDAKPPVAPKVLGTSRATLCCGCVAVWCVSEVFELFSCVCCGRCAIPHVRA